MPSGSKKEEDAFRDAAEEEEVNFLLLKQPGKLGGSGEVDQLVAQIRGYTPQLDLQVIRPAEKAQLPAVLPLLQSPWKKDVPQAPQGSL
jgi:hypothetical protein